MKTFYSFTKVNLLHIGLMFVLTLMLNTTFFAQSVLLGMTSKGGEGSGVIFNLNIGATDYNFQTNIPLLNPGTYPRGLIKANNGLFYGTTLYGGAYGYGVLFEYNMNKNVYTKKLDFNGLTNGKSPSGGLIQASNGKFYGMTSYGGDNDLGVLFEYDAENNAYVKLLDFNGTAMGSKPMGTLMQASNGKLYGTTSSGGANNNGILFEYDIFTNTFNKKIDFSSSSSGNYPGGQLIECSAGQLYGMTALGGAYGKGLIYQYNILKNSVTKKVDFNGINGRNPFNNSLMKASESKLYGLTTTGGVNDLGVLFEYDVAANSFTKKVDFGGAFYGASPIGRVMKSDNGRLYGTNVAGGSKGFGVMFEYDMTTSTFKKIFDFNGGSGGVADPCNLVIQAAPDKLLGMTDYGGNSNKGVLFQYDLKDGVYSEKLSFMDKRDGATPFGSLTFASNGLFYGLTSEGGTNGLGCLFEYNLLTNAYTKKISFNGSGNGAAPYGSLIQAKNGKLYGMTSRGGAKGMGTLFEYDARSNTFHKLIDFDGAVKGKFPYGSLIQASNGKLYGMTNSGGVNNRGVLFEYDILYDAYSVKVNFDDVSNGSNPWGNLIEASPGKLYGLTNMGGVNHFGVLFVYDIDKNACMKKVDFDGVTIGRYPMGSLTKANNGMLYGMTYEGGATNLGVIFEYDPGRNIMAKEFDFSNANGSNPRGSLIQASNDKLYGMTSYGGDNNLGVLFEYNYKMNAYAKKIDFDGASGALPMYGNLIEVLGVSGLDENEEANNSFDIFPNPTTDAVKIKTEDIKGNITLLNALGQAILTQPITEKVFELDLRNLIEGIYYIRIQQPKGTAVRKVIKE